MKNEEVKGSRFRVSGMQILHLEDDLSDMVVGKSYHIYRRINREKYSKYPMVGKSTED
ncbi:MAG: hypothetical protein QXD10_09240 [Metallosphaera sp.]|uniref:hypothetical protein n=1 Tax=Metallosphaera sp. TaxID=2020860 RepID=UPI003167BDB8